MKNILIIISLFTLGFIVGCDEVDSNYKVEKSVTVIVEFRSTKKKELTWYKIVTNPHGFGDDNGSWFVDSTGKFDINDTLVFIKK